ncbi:unnamed protein product [Brassica napus]|uniref:(rape) hypothetical protein n=1 Tax=Brassica napus TaxID=3708 RepID=A0A816IZM3_BRANA|nr:unnamed protein product [Brassica napus]
MDDKSDLLHMQMAHLPLRLWLRRCVSGESHENLTEGVNLKPVSFMSQLNYMLWVFFIGDEIRISTSANSFNELPPTPMIISRMALLWLGDTILPLRFHPAASLTDHTCRVVSLYVGASRLFSGSVDNSINSHIEMCRTLICCSICFQEQPASFRVCCDGSPSAANNVFTLIAVIIFYGFLITPYRRFITVKAIFINFTVRRLHQNGFVPKQHLNFCFLFFSPSGLSVLCRRLCYGKGLGGSCLCEKKSAYQAMMKYNNVQLAEDHVAHRHARALERSQIFNQTTTELSIDEKDNIYDFEKTYEVRILQKKILLVL